MRALILFAHPLPRHSRVNKKLLESVRDLSDVEVRDLYELYPDFVIDTVAEQAALLRCQVLVMQHPFYWYSVPALLKEWMDNVFQLGFAYGPGGTALKGKKFWQVISTGGSAAAYAREGHNNFSVKELLRPVEQSAVLCGMTPLEPLILYDAASVSDEALAAHARKYRSELRAIQENRILPSYATV